MYDWDWLIERLLKGEADESIQNEFFTEKVMNGEEYQDYSVTVSTNSIFNGMEKMLYGLGFEKLLAKDCFTRLCHIYEKGLFRIEMWTYHDLSRADLIVRRREETELGLRNVDFCLIHADCKKTEPILRKMVERWEKWKKEWAVLGAMMEECKRQVREEEEKAREIAREILEGRKAEFCLRRDKEKWRLSVRAKYRRQISITYGTDADKTTIRRLAKAAADLEEAMKNSGEIGITMK